MVFVYSPLKQFKLKDDYPVFLSNDIRGSLIHSEDFHHKVEHDTFDLVRFSPRSEIITYYHDKHDSEGKPTERVKEIVEVEKPYYNDIKYVGKQIVFSNNPRENYAHFIDYWPESYYVYDEEGNVVDRITLDQRVHDASKVILGSSSYDYNTGLKYHRIIKDRWVQDIDNFWDINIRNMMAIELKADYVKKLDINYVVTLEVLKKTNFYKGVIDLYSNILRYFFGPIYFEKGSSYKGFLGYNDKWDDYQVNEWCCANFEYLYGKLSDIYLKYISPLAYSTQAIKALEEDKLSAIKDIDRFFFLNYLIPLLIDYYDKDMYGHPDDPRTEENWIYHLKKWWFEKDYDERIKAYTDGEFVFHLPKIALNSVEEVGLMEEKARNLLLSFDKVNNTITPLYSHTLKCYPLLSELEKAVNRKYLFNDKKILEVTEGRVKELRKKIPFNDLFITKYQYRQHLKNERHILGYDPNDPKRSNSNATAAYKNHNHKEGSIYGQFDCKKGNIILKGIEKIAPANHIHSRYSLKNHEHDEEYAPKKHTHNTNFSNINHEHPEYAPISDDCEFPFRGSIVSYYQGEDCEDSRCFKSEIKRIEEVDLGIVRALHYFNNNDFAFKYTFNINLCKLVFNKLESEYFYTDESKEAITERFSKIIYDAFRAAFLEKEDFRNEVLDYFHKDYTSLKEEILNEIATKIKPFVFRYDYYNTEEEKDNLTNLSFLSNLEVDSSYENLYLEVFVKRDKQDLVESLLNFDECEEEDLSRNLYSVKIQTILDLAKVKKLTNSSGNRIVTIFDDNFTYDNFFVDFNLFYFDIDSEFVDGMMELDKSIPTDEFFTSNTNAYAFIEIRINSQFVEKYKEITGRDFSKIRFYLRNTTKNIYSLTSDLTDLKYFKFINKIQRISYTGTERRNVINSGFVSSAELLNYNGSFDDVNRGIYPIDKENGGSCEFNFKFYPITDFDKWLRFKFETNGGYSLIINNKVVSSNATEIYGKSVEPYCSQEDFSSWTIKQPSGNESVKQVFLEESEVIFGQNNAAYLFKAFDAKDDVIESDKEFSLKFSLFRDNITEESTSSSNIDQIIFYRNNFNSDSSKFEIGIERNIIEGENFIYIDFEPLKDFIKKSRNYDVEDETDEDAYEDISYNFCRLRFKTNIPEETWTDFIIRKSNKGFEVIKDNIKVDRVECERFYIDDEGKTHKTFVPSEKILEYSELKKRKSYTTHYEWNVGGSQRREEYCAKNIRLRNFAFYDKYIEVEDNLDEYLADYRIKANTIYDVKLIYKQPVSSERVIFTPKIAEIVDQIYNENWEIEDNKFKVINNNNFLVYYENPIDLYTIGFGSVVLGRKLNIEYNRPFTGKREGKVLKTYYKFSEKGTDYLGTFNNKIFDLDLSELVIYKNLEDAKVDSNLLELTNEKSSDSYKYLIGYTWKICREEDLTTSFFFRKNEHELAKIKITNLSNGAQFFSEGTTYTKLDGSFDYIEERIDITLQANTEYKFEVILEYDKLLNGDGFDSIYYQDSDSNMYGKAQEEILEEDDGSESINKEWRVFLGHRDDPKVNSIIDKNGKTYEMEDYRVFPSLFVLDEFGNQIPFVKNVPATDIEKKCLNGTFYTYGFTESEGHTLTGKTVKDRTLIVKFYKKENENIEQIRFNGRLFILF